MKRLLLGLAGLVLCTSLAFAQTPNITRSLQGSQDPRGPVGVDTSTNLYTPNHLNIFGTVGSAPTVQSCNVTGATSAQSEDNAGIFKSGAGTTCQLVFGQPFAIAPACLVMAQAGATEPTYTTTVSLINLTTVVASTNYAYLCFGQQ